MSTSFQVLTKQNFEILNKNSPNLSQAAHSSLNSQTITTSNLIVLIIKLFNKLLILI